MEDDAGLSTLVSGDRIMATATESRIQTVADLLEGLGGVPPSRVLMTPTPGTATEADVIAIHDRANRLCELVDGTLVEKAMGFEEARFAGLLVLYLGNYVLQHDLGVFLPPDGMMRLFPGLVRIPDVSFISWERCPKGKAAIPDVVPDLVVEILSKSNTRKEMERKLDEYLRAGVRLVWCVDPETRSAWIYEAGGVVRELTEADALDGGEVLPGFRLSPADWFAEAERTGPKA